MTSKTTKTRRGTKATSAIWISTEIHTHVRSAIGLMNFARPKDEPALTLGSLTERALLHDIERFYAEHGQALPGLIRNQVKTATQDKK